MRGLRTRFTVLAQGSKKCGVDSKAFTRCFYSTLSRLQAPVKCAPADSVILDQSDASIAAADEVLPTLLQPRVVVYDGVCHLCHTDSDSSIIPGREMTGSPVTWKGVKMIIKADTDKKIKFCCLQSRAAEPYMRFCGVDRDDVLRRFLFVEGPGLCHQGSSAGLRVLSYLPFPYSALSSLMIVPTPLRDAVYDYVAKHRYDWFGKDDDCVVLKQTELLERFIDWKELLDRIRSKQS